MSEHIHYGTDPFPGADVLKPGIPAAPEAPFWAKLEGLPSMMKALAQARWDVKVAKAGADVALMRLQSTSEYGALATARVEVSETQGRVDCLDAAVRKAALDDFRANGAKAVCAGASVKFFTKVEYDPKLMRDWAKQNMTSLLTLDVKGVDVAARAGLLEDAPVTVTKEPRVIIASDLSSHLGEVKP